jgi:flagellin
MKGDSGMYKSIDEGLTMTKNVVSTARLGAETFADLAKQVGERVAFAQGVGVNLADVQSEIDALTERMNTVIEQSTFNGVSMVDNATTLTVVTGVSRDGTAFNTTSIDITGQNLSTIQSALAGIDLEAAAAGTGTGINASLEDVLTGAEGQLALAVNAATNLGISEKSIDTQQNFLKDLTDRLDKSVGSLVDADMEKEAARLQALQVQQQLATQSLSIANQAPQNIMALFR